MKLLDLFPEHNDGSSICSKELVIRESADGRTNAPSMNWEVWSSNSSKRPARRWISSRAAKPGGGFLYASWNSNAPATDLLMGHLDTVCRWGRWAICPCGRAARGCMPRYLDESRDALIIKVMGLLHLHGGLPAPPGVGLFTTDEERGSIQAREFGRKSGGEFRAGAVFERATQGEMVKTIRGAERHVIPSRRRDCPLIRRRTRKRDQRLSTRRLPDFADYLVGCAGTKAVGGQ